MVLIGMGFVFFFVVYVFFEFGKELDLMLKWVEDVKMCWIIFMFWCWGSLWFVYFWILFELVCLVVVLMLVLGILLFVL